MRTNISTKLKGREKIHPECEKHHPGHEHSTLIKTRGQAEYPNSFLSVS